MTEMKNIAKGSPLEGLSSINLEKIKYIVSDVDDTITSSSRLLSTTLNKMEEAEKKGYRIILVSGGSAGWCEVYLRQWPVYRVIAESGALLIYKDECDQVKYLKNPAITDEDIKKRAKLLSMIEKEYLSSDQYARVFDIAVDLKNTPKEKLEEIKELADEMGAHYASSSIHLNIWFGDYSKVNGLIAFFKREGIDEARLKEESIYLGDAKNDEEAFSFFSLSIGMKSVEDNRESFDVLPTYISNFYGGKGFEEVISLLL